MITTCTGNLIPARFLVLLAHMTICIINISSMKENIYACLPEGYDEVDYQRKSYQLQLGLYFGLALIAVELTGFLSGTSMFLPAVGSLSVGCHASASILMAQSLIDNWSCYAYWWIFGFCSAVPAVVEIVVAFNTYFLKKT